MNEDGLIPGQPVDFETIQRVEAQRRINRNEEQDQPKPKRGRPIKIPGADGKSRSGQSPE